MADPRIRTRRRVLALWSCAAVMAGALATVPFVSGAGTRERADFSFLTGSEGAAFDHNRAHLHASAAVRARAAARLAACEAGTAGPGVSCPEPGATTAEMRMARLEAATASPFGSTEPDGVWGPLLDIPSTAIHAVVLPTGKVLFFSQPKFPTEQETDGGNAHVFDPATGTTRSVPPPVVDWPTGPDRPANLWCGGQTQLADGRVLVVGGNLAYPENGGLGAGNGFKGGTWVMTFDPWTETWTRYADMPHGRWYPTLTRLGDGRVLIVGGWDESGGVDNGGAGVAPRMVNNLDVEVFDPSTPPGGQATTVVSHLPPNVVGQTGPWPNHEEIGLYPHMFLLPSTTQLGAGGNKVLVAGPGKWDSAVIDTTTWLWTDVVDKPDVGQPRLSQDRFWGTAYLAPGGVRGSDEVVVLGGSDAGGAAPGPGTSPPPVATAETLDLDDPDAGWHLGGAPALNTARAHFNTVLLPDGSVFTNGGGYGRKSDTLYADPVYSAEHLPAGGTAWRTVGSEADARTYHSVSVLLPDGRVLSAGDDRDIAPTHIPADARTAQAWSPPYLFDGPRPVVTFAPTALRYDVGFRVAVQGDPAAITGATLVHPAAVTHAVDMGQRVIRLDVTAQPDGLTMRTPLDASVAPPGYYMLFLLNASGVPSVASWIRLGADAPDAPPLPVAPAPPPAPTAPPTPTTPAAPTPPPLRLSAGRPVARPAGTRVRVRMSARTSVAAAVLMTLVRPDGRVVARRSFRSAAGRTAVRDLAPSRAALRGTVRLRARVRATAAGGRRAERAFTVRVPAR